MEGEVLREEMEKGARYREEKGWIKIKPYVYCLSKAYHYWWIEVGGGREGGKWRERRLYG